ncbi:hypothetical protein QT235_15305 [Geobacillus stearothermophilus]|nr:hypothetical protein GLN3_06900 [Geobacillus lituanicus]WJQ06585.1 hypothetical protein QT235_15305 [Geobacillus stearothermophilus]
MARAVSCEATATAPAPSGPALSLRLARKRASIADVLLGSGRGNCAFSPPFVEAAKSKNRLLK